MLGSDLPAGAKQSHSMVLTLEEEAIIVGQLLAHLSDFAGAYKFANNSRV
jgi:hypothetical protein